MSDASRAGGPEEPSPDQKEVADPGRRNYDAMQVFQSLIEIQKDISILGTKTDRLILDVDKLEKKVDKRIDALDEKVDKLSHALAWAKGFAVAAVLLIPISAAAQQMMGGAPQQGGPPGPQRPQPGGAVAAPRQPMGRTPGLVRPDNLSGGGALTMPRRA